MSAFENKSAIVTGGANGVGRAVAELMAAAGALVTIADVDRVQGAEVAEAIGGVFVECDVAIEEDNRTAVRTAVYEHGRLDIIVLNAGIAPWCPVGPDFDTDHYRRTMSVNLDGVVFGMNAAIAGLMQSGGGSIVAIASIAGLMGTESNPIYSASKHAVVGLVRAVAPSLREHQIKVNAICPGFIDTTLVGQVRDSVQQSGIPLMTPGDIAKGVVAVILQAETGHAWVMQPGIELEPYRFRGVPGARNADGSRINLGASPAIAWRDSIR